MVFISKKNIVMLVSLLLQLKVFLFIMAVFVVLAGILHTVAVFSKKQGKIVSSENKLIVFAFAVAYILTMLICGF